MQGDGTNEHAYGPVGQALGMFAGFLDRATLDTIHGAMRDAASQEWDWANEQQDFEVRAYHATRWSVLTLGADYAALLAGDASPEWSQ